MGRCILSDHVGKVWGKNMIRKLLLISILLIWAAFHMVF